MRLHPTLLMLLALVALAYPAVSAAQWQLNGAPVCTAAQAQSFPEATTDGAGGAIIVWSDLRNGVADVYIQRVDAAGIPQWGQDGLALCTASNVQDQPVIVSDGAGGAIVAWTDFRPIPGSGVPAVDIYAQRVDAFGSVQWTGDGVAISRAVGQQNSPRIATDSAGGAMGPFGAIITWVDQRNGAKDIYVQRVSASGVPQWTMDGVALCTAAQEQSDVTIVADDVGGAIVAWHDWRSLTETNVHAQRVDAFGAVQWTGDGEVVCAATGNQHFPAIASDGASGAIIAWMDSRVLANNQDVYAQRMDASGVAQWTADGVGLCVDTNTQFAPVIVADASGGAIAAWPDYRNGDGDVYTQRIDASGSVQWTSNGVALCTAVDDQYSLAITSDGSGGAIVAWEDHRVGLGDSDMYARRVSTAGVPQWAANGVPLCTATGGQTNPVIVSNGSGGAIAAWNDVRGTSIDIYAQEVEADGTVNQTPVGVGDTPLMAAFAVSNIPNPFSATTEFQIKLPAASDITIEIYDVAGRRVRVLKSERARAGWQQVPFSGRDADGRALASGVYFCRVHAAGATVTHKIVIAR